VSDGAAGPTPHVKQKMFNAHLVVVCRQLTEDQAAQQRHLVEQPGQIQQLLRQLHRRHRLAAAVSSGNSGGVKCE